MEMGLYPGPFESKYCTLIKLHYKLPFYLLSLRRAISQEREASSQFVCLSVSECGILQLTYTSQKAC